MLDTVSLSVHPEEGERPSRRLPVRLWRVENIKPVRRKGEGYLWQDVGGLLNLNGLKFGLIETKGWGFPELTHPHSRNIDELSSVRLTVPSFSVLADSYRKICSFYNSVSHSTQPLGLGFHRGEKEERHSQGRVKSLEV